MHLLLSPYTGELFALCPYDISGNSVEAVLDSSRYFVLRVESQDPSTGNKKKAYIGMGVSMASVMQNPSHLCLFRLSGLTCYRFPTHY